MATPSKRRKVSSSTSNFANSASFSDGFSPPFLSGNSENSPFSACTRSILRLCRLPILSMSVVATVTPENIGDMKLYDLSELLPKEESSTSEDLCSLFFQEKVVKGMEEVKITVRKKVLVFQRLYPLYATTDQRPDLTVSRKMDNLPLILVEVHSSPFAITVNKTILGVTDQLRLYRTYDASITRCVGFAFPKKDFKQCVVIVSVTWEKLCFRYTLTPIKDIELVESTIKHELCTATASAPSPGLNQELRFLVPLSQEDLGLIGDGANGSPVQLPSRASILVRHGMDYFKSPADLKESFQLLEMTYIPRALPTIKLHLVMVGVNRFFKYRGIPIDPLTRPEAQSCLYDLVPKLVQVMESFHQNGWAHQDIRLENICFDEDYMPVFIDLDRCKRSGDQAYDGKGCMYSMGGSPIKTDWLQLGLMVCWVLDRELGQEEKVGDYHNRDCKKICESLQDTFLNSLIGKGMWVCCAHVVLWVLIPSKQLGRLAFLGPHLCLSIPTEALCSTFIRFFCFSPRQI